VKNAWLSGLALIVLAPVAVCAYAGPGVPASRVTALAVMTGTQALGLLVYSVLFISRMRSVTRVFGIEHTVTMHRLLGSLTLAFVLVHLLLVLVDNPDASALLDLPDAPPRAAAGLGALISLIALIGLTRIRQRLSYEVWRRWHLGLAGLVVLLSVLHIIWLSRLIHSPLWSGLFALLGLVLVGALAHRWLYRPWRTRAGFTVRDIVPVADGVTSVLLHPRSRSGQWHFAPGQFAWLRLSRSPFAEDHPFSMSSAPGNEVEFCISHVGDWTTGELARIRPGKIVWLDGPHGSITLDRATQPHIVMVAAGAGIAPVLSMLLAMASARDPRQVTLLIPSKHLYTDEIRRLKLWLKLSVNTMLPREITPLSLAAQLPDDPSELDVFICGPASMVSDTVHALHLIGVPETQVHVERFEVSQ
jgi:predicted ferric reductase